MSDEVKKTYIEMIVVGNNIERVLRDHPLPSSKYDLLIFSCCVAAKFIKKIKMLSHEG